MKLAQAIFSLSWPGKFRLAWRLLSDGRVPPAAKSVFALMVFYPLIPFDVIPDWIPGLGQLDDVVVLVVGGFLFSRLCPPSLLDDLIKHAEEAA